jgi:hypothetical protein
MTPGAISTVPYRARARSHLRACLAIALLGACSSPTGIEALPVTLREVVLASDEERTAWPGTPTVLGGEGVRVRGTAFIGCGRAVATARRHGDIVAVDIAAVDTDRFCPASLSAWQPFEATVTGLATGTYRVRVTVVGHDGRAEWSVRVTGG